MLYLGIDQHAKQLTVSLRNHNGDVVLKRQVSTEPKRCLEFLTGLKEKAGQDGYVAIVEVCGFNDWLLALLPKYGCVQSILIQPTKKPKVKTDRRDAHALSELLWATGTDCESATPSVVYDKLSCHRSSMPQVNVSLCFAKMPAGCARVRPIGSSTFSGGTTSNGRCPPRRSPPSKQLLG